MNAVVLLTITFYGLTTCQFSPLSSSDLNNNHVYSTESILSCNIASWYSSYYQKNIFMLSYFDSISQGEAPFLTSDLLWFSMNYSYYLSKSFNISDINTYPIDPYYISLDFEVNPVLMDVVLSPSSIMVLSQLRGSGEQHLFYRIIRNYQNAPSHDIYISPMRTWKIPNCEVNEESCSSVTASKLYGSDLFIIVYENLNSLLHYLVNESTSYPLSLTPNQLVSQIDILSVSPGSAWVTGIKVRASKTSEMYLIVWSVVDCLSNFYTNDAAVYTNCDHAVRASLHRNDGSVVNSMVDIVRQILSRQYFVYLLYDVISFNISAETGFYAILYYDDQISRLCIRILDDFASDLFGDGTMINVRELETMMPSATIRVLDLVPPPKHKLYFVVSWSYVEEVYTDQVRPGAVYIQMFEFSWTSSMDKYHLYAT
eukprot:293910_1